MSMSFDAAHRRALAEVRDVQAREGRETLIGGRFVKWSLADYAMLADRTEHHMGRRGGVEDGLTVEGFSTGVSSDAQWLR